MKFVESILLDWLQLKLGPICNTDESELAKYVVYLLVQHEDSNKLRETMISELKEFLLEKSEEFVDELIRSLNGNMYSLLFYY